MDREKETEQETERQRCNARQRAHQLEEYTGILVEVLQLFPNLKLSQKEWFKKNLEPEREESHCTVCVLNDLFALKYFLLCDSHLNKNNKELGIPNCKDHCYLNSTEQTGHTPQLPGPRQGLPGPGVTARSAWGTFPAPTWPSGRVFAKSVGSLFTVQITYHYPRQMHAKHLDWVTSECHISQGLWYT